VEIARAAAGEGSVLILDEPTAALSAQEAERLFALIRRLRGAGVAMIYITHRLDEVAEIGDRVQVLRDGHVVLTAPVGAVNRAELVRAMVGSGLGEIERPDESGVAGEEVLALEEASAQDSSFTNIDVAVRSGEVVTLYGKLGSGTHEVAEAAFGLRTLERGAMRVEGRSRVFSRPRQAIAAGVGFLPADRKQSAAFAGRSVAENLCAPSWGRLGKFRVFLTAAIEARAYQRWHDVLKVRSRNEPGQPISTLSGGNQQKVLLGRWFERGCRVLVLVEPTRGVDVGARQDIYRSVRNLADAGTGVLVVTSDYEEVVQLADRAFVMARGRVVADLTGEDITTARLTEAAGG
jgi:ribose transport system ATP-binding protein